MRFTNFKNTCGYIFMLLLVTLALAPESSEAQQQGSRRRSRRRPAPQVLIPQQQPVAPAAAATRDAEVVGSTEDRQQFEGAGTSETTTEEVPLTGTGRAEPLQRTVERLSSQINQLTRKINQLEGQSRAIADFDRLSRAEQRAETLQSQMRQLQDKEMNLRARTEQLDYEMRPESLVRRTEMIGSLNPDAMRQQVRQQLEREKQMITTQLEQLAASRSRLEESIASADSYVERLRKRVEAADDEQNEESVSRGQREPATTSTEVPATPQ